MSASARATFRGIFAGLAIVAAAAFCALAVVGFSSEQKKRAAIQPKLSEWPQERVLAELADPDMLDACENLLGEAGTGYKCRLWGHDGWFVLVASASE